MGMFFARSSPVCSSGVTSLVMDRVYAREQIHQLRPASMPLMRTGAPGTPESRLGPGALRGAPAALPCGPPHLHEACTRPGRGSRSPCFLAGDRGAKEQVAHSDLRNEIQDSEIRCKLKNGNMDFWLALMVEDLIPGTRAGPTLMCPFVTQFQWLRDGDRLSAVLPQPLALRLSLLTTRFWYENPGVFTPAQLTQLRQASLGRVLCDNGDNIQQVQADVFAKAKYPQDYLSCDEIPQVDLRMWQDCCEDCRSRGQFRTFTQESRKKRSAQYSYPDEKDKELSDLISRQQDHLYIDEDSKNMTVLAKTKFAQDFSSFAVEIQKTIKALREQINKLEALLRQAGCTDDKGIRRKDNEHWMKEDCISCMESGQVTCVVKTCPPAPCPSLELVKGACCPVCRDRGMPADSSEKH
ncbi:Probable oxidoreductase PXDNL [Vulpes lagopus]